MIPSDAPGFADREVEAPSERTNHTGSIGEPIDLQALLGRRSLGILLVEDDEAHALLFRALLEDSKDYEFSVTHSRSMREALDNLSAQHFDAVLLDLSLPDSSGFDTVSALRNAYPDVPVVVLTAHDDPSLSGKVIRWGAQGYLFKGESYGHRLEQAIRDAIGRRTVEQELARHEPLLSALASSTDLNDLLRAVLETLCENSSWIYGEAWLPSSDGKLLERSSIWYAKSSRLEGFAEVSTGFKMPPDEELTGRAWRSKQIVWVHDVATEMEFRRGSLAADCGLGAGTFIPVLRGTEPVAVLALFASAESAENLENAP